MSFDESVRRKSSSGLRTDQLPSRRGYVSEHATMKDEGSILCDKEGVTPLEEYQTTKLVTNFKGQ